MTNCPWGVRDDLTVTHLLWNRFSAKHSVGRVTHVLSFDPPKNPIWPPGTSRAEHETLRTAMEKDG